ncbi:ABC transporter permease [Spirochaetota bacterium]|nr:ABC transporter permease [Spirochaetota bacterium]
MEYGYLFLEGAVYTLAVGVVSLVIATVLGIVIALMKLSSLRSLQWAARFYTTVVRGVPDLVMMLLFFYGVQIIINNIIEVLELDIYILLNPFLAGVLAIGFIFGAYMAETFRGAILAISRNEIEAAHAYGLSGKVLFWRIIFPQLIRYGLSSFTNNWLVLLKTTSLVSVIGLNDMVRMANVAASSTKQPFIFYSVVLVIFLIYTSVSLWGLNVLKKRYHFS